MTLRLRVDLGWWDALRSRWQGVWCAARGHGSHLLIERNRLALVCECGCESPGWDLHTTAVRFMWKRQRRPVNWRVGQLRRVI